MKIKGTLILTIVSLLERLSYFGVRAILVLYATESDALNIDKNQFFEIYGYWTSAIVMASIPFSLITDKYLGQKRSIYFGGTITLIGYLLLLIQFKYVLIFSIFLILAGTSLVKPSTAILIGRQFEKESKKRTLAYMVFFLGINIGAFLGVIGIGYIGEIYEWKYGFIIAAIATLIYLIIAYCFRRSIEEIETNEFSNRNIKLTIKRTYIIIPLLVLINIIFWKNHDIQSSELLLTLTNVENRTFLGYELLNSWLQSFLSIWTFPLSLALFIYWYIKGVTNSFKAISISLVLLILAILGTTVINQIQPNNLLEWSFLPIAIYAFAEVIISPILTSYVTRIADVNYSNTIYSTYILLTYVVGAGFVYLLQNEYQLYITFSTLTLSIIGVLLFNDQIRKLTYELE